MPELPEVETIRRALAPEIDGRRVIEAWSHPSTKFLPAREIVGATFGGIDRRGKYLIITLDSGIELIVHLGMTGQLRIGDEDFAIDDYVRAWWTLDDGRILVYRDVRRFGRLRVVHTGDYHDISTLDALGPEPLSDEFTPDRFWAATKQSSRRIKTQLLSQVPVAGVGNIYADEACWLAGIHPGSRRLTKRQATALHSAIVEVLRQGLDNNGTTLSDYRTISGETGDNQHHLCCYGRGGSPCLRCGDNLRSTVYDARTTTYCPTCQSR